MTQSPTGTPRPSEPGRARLVDRLRGLIGHSAIYGAADVFGNVVNLFLLPVYTRFLGPAEYGVLALLLLFGTLAKIVFRLGLDAAFFRVYYDLESEAERRRLAGTVVLFAAVVGTSFFGLIVLSRDAIGSLLFHGTATPSSWVVLVALDVYLGTFAFVPLCVLRIQGRSRLFAALAAGRHAINTILKVIFLTRGLGIEGVLWSDLLATGAYSLAVAPVLVRHVAWVFSPTLLREVLGLGVPRVPNGLFIQAQNMADRYILDGFVSRADVGVYQMGYTLGTAVKFALSAFEPAWQPFVYSQMKKPDAARGLAEIVTWAWAGFVAVGLLVAVLSREVVTLFTHHRGFADAVPLVPIVVLAYLFHGAFLLTSVGIGIEKRARFYPIITACAAATNIGANLFLIPHFGTRGAAWATVLSYAVMAALGATLSQRVYPIPFERGRLARIVVAASAAFALSTQAPLALLPGLAVKAGALTAFPALLLASGFLLPEERAWLRHKWRGSHS